MLREYLEKREVEVMDIMTMLFDQETVTNTYINDVLRQGRAEGRAEGEAKGRADTARNLLRMGLAPSQISEATGLFFDDINALRGEQS